MKNLFISLRLLVALTILTGVIYPVSVTLLGGALFKDKAGGSLLVKNGSLVGSELIAQGFAKPEYFWPRPSAVKYDSASSGATNLTLTSSTLVNNVHERRAKGFTEEMLFESGSGLDPHISYLAALSQVRRIGEARRLSQSQIEAVKALVQRFLEGRQFGFLGEERINVVDLNLALDEALR